MIEAGQSLVVPIIFTPREAVEYRERLEFLINDFTKAYVNMRGRGTPLRLELTQMSNPKLIMKDKSLNLKLISITH
jgi:hypothetical protein